MTDKKYKDLSDVLAPGRHIIDVRPKPEFDESGSIIAGSHKSGKSKHGSWYMYSTKIGDDWINIFANDKTKEFFDSGRVSVNIVQKFDQDTGQPVMRTYFDPATGSSPATAQDTTSETVAPSEAKSNAQETVDAADF